MVARLPPTSAGLRDDRHRPYFLWWTDATVGDLRRRLVDPVCGQVAPFHLGGGAALAGIHLRHRLSADADLFLHDRQAHRALVAALSVAGESVGARVELEPLTVDQLREFRDELRERLRRLAVP